MSNLLDPQILQWIAFGGSLVSVWLYGFHDLRGPIAGIATAGAFMVFGAVAHLPAAILSNVVFLILHIRNARNAMRDDMERKKKLLTSAVALIVDEAHGASSKAGWWEGVDVHNDKHVVPAKLCLIHSEISEAMEGHRKNAADDKLPHRSMIEVELADAMIRIADLAGALDLDLGGALAEKMEFNMTRPDHKVENRRRGGGKAY